MDTERFQIDAKSDAPQPRGTMNGSMLRALLEDRFSLVIRRQVKEAPVYTLIVAKGGIPKMPHSAGNCITFDPEHPPVIEPGEPFPVVCGMSRNIDKGHDTFGVTMARFAEILSDYADRKVIDRTKVSGEFDIHLSLYPSDLGHASTHAPDNDARTARDSAEIFANVRAEVRKLGLRIELAKGPAEFLLVQRAEKPSAN